MDTIIKTENISFSYPRTDSGEQPPVINDISLEIERGTFTAIIGHNGSGKTTLAKHFNAILLPDTGRVFVCGIDTSDETRIIDIRRRIGMVFQNPDNQIVATVVEEDVAFAPENLGIPSAEIRERVDEALHIVDMFQYRKHASHLLSGGQKQRIAIAGVLAMKPECIVFDEPTAMLDPRGREAVVKIMRDLADRHGITIILITHHMSEAAAADRLIVMTDGQIVKDGTPAEVFLDIDTLHKAGLNIPETSLLLHKLRDDGFDISPGALTVDDCAAAVYGALSKNNHSR